MKNAGHATNINHVSPRNYVFIQSTGVYEWRWYDTLGHSMFSNSNEYSLCAYKLLVINQISFRIETNSDGFATIVRTYNSMHTIHICHPYSTHVMEILNVKRKNLKQRFAGVLVVFSNPLWIFLYFIPIMFLARWIETIEISRNFEKQKKYDTHNIQIQLSNDEVSQPMLIPLFEFENVIYCMLYAGPLFNGQHIWNTYVSLLLLYIFSWFMGIRNTQKK